MPDTPSLKPPLTPSKIDALKNVVSGAPITALTIFAAITGLVTAVQSCNTSLDTARVSYETLRAASEKNTAQIEAVRKGQADLQSWVGELSSRLEQRQVTAEKAIARKQTRPQAPPAPPPLVVEPAPKPPEVPVVVAPAPLPSFAELNH